MLFIWLIVYKVYICMFSDEKSKIECTWGESLVFPKQLQIQLLVEDRVVAIHVVSPHNKDEGRFSNQHHFGSHVRSFCLILYQSFTDLQQDLRGPWPIAGAVQCSVPVPGCALPEGSCCCTAFLSRSELDLELTGQTLQRCNRNVLQLVIYSVLSCFCMERSYLGLDFFFPSMFERKTLFY